MKMILTRDRLTNDLERLQQAKAMQASLGMLKLATENRKELKVLPADLRERANKILYTKHGLKLAEDLIEREEK